MKTRFGLTGSIGSGKSTVSSMFKELGAAVIDADRVSHELLQEDGSCKERAAQHFGSGILNNDGSIDRKRLAKIVFSDANERNALNAILHPAVLEKMREESYDITASDPARIIIFDVPLLFESGFFRETDENILVICDQHSIIERVMERDGVSDEEVLSRLKAQMSQEEKQLLADHVIDNNGSMEELRDAVKNLYEYLIHA